MASWVCESRPPSLHPSLLPRRSVGALLARPPTHPHVDLHQVIGVVLVEGLPLSHHDHVVVDFLKHACRRAARTPLEQRTSSPPHGSAQQRQRQSCCCRHDCIRQATCSAPWMLTALLPVLLLKPRDRRATCDSRVLPPGRPAFRHAATPAPQLTFLLLLHLVLERGRHASRQRHEQDEQSCRCAAALSSSPLQDVEMPVQCSHGAVLGGELKAGDPVRGPHKPSAAWWPPGALHAVLAAAMKRGRERALAHTDHKPAQRRHTQMVSDTCAAAGLAACSPTMKQLAL